MTEGGKDYLFIGGPWHGEEHEVPYDRPTWNVFTEPAGIITETRPGIGASVPVATTYIRRQIAIKTTDNRRFSRDFYVHEDIPNPQVAQVALTDALMQRWITGGSQVIDAEVVPTDGG